MQGASFKPRRACLRPLENFLRDPKPQKIQNFAFFALFGVGVEFLLKMKILDVVTLGDDSDSLIRRITPNFFSALRLWLGDSKVAKLQYKNIFRLSYGSFVWFEPLPPNPFFHDVYIHHGYSISKNHQGGLVYQILICYISVSPPKLLRDLNPCLGDA